MPVSESILSGNRAEARKILGPSLPRGKSASRHVELKNRLVSSACRPETAEEIQDYAVAFFRGLKPRTWFDAWLIDRMAVTAFRIDRCERIERRARDRQGLRAEVDWDAERLAEAVDLAEKLAASPESVVEALRLTPQGCLWMIDRWERLAEAAEVGDWTEGQIAMAFDLLGIPHDFREGKPPWAFRVDVGPPPSPAGFARLQAEALAKRLETVNEVDEIDRYLIANDLDDDDSPELKRLRRHERELYRRFDWLLKHFGKPNQPWEARPEFFPRWASPDKKPEPAPPVEVKQDKDGRIINAHKLPYEGAPFDLLPHEIPADPTERPNYQEILDAREDARKERDEERRRRRRRRIDENKG